MFGVKWLGCQSFQSLFEKYNFGIFSLWSPCLLNALMNYGETEGKPLIACPRSPRARGDCLEL